MQFDIDRSFMSLNIFFLLAKRHRDVYSNSGNIFIFGLLSFADRTTFNIFLQSTFIFATKQNDSTITMTVPRDDTKHCEVSNGLEMAHQDIADT